MIDYALTARDLKAIAQLLHARRLSSGGLAISGHRIGELSARFAVMADEAETNRTTYTFLPTSHAVAGESAHSTPRAIEKVESGPDFGPESDSHEDRGYPPPRCKHEWGINGCQKCGQPAMPRG